MKQGIAVKKPVKIDWIEWIGKDGYECIKELHKWVESFEDDLDEHFIWSIDSRISQNSTLSVMTLEGTSYSVPSGYIIIRGIEGEYYPCDPKIFHKTYTIKEN